MKGYHAAVEALGEMIINLKDELYIKDIANNHMKSELETEKNLHNETKQELEILKQKIATIEKYMEAYSN